MRLRRLEIERFRGVRALDWSGLGQTSALVGPGDTGKSTILEAIERVSSPRWNLAFDDTDFWNADTTEPIVVRATLTDLPNAFYADHKFGLSLHVFDEAAGVARDPSGGEGEVEALVIELRVDRDLEPAWSVLTPSGGRDRLSTADREALGVLRVGGYLDRHLGWSRGSVLSRLTDRGGELSRVLAEASRSAREALDHGGLAKLQVAADTVKEAARDFGVAPRTGLSPNLDPASTSMRSGAISERCR